MLPVNWVQRAVCRKIILPPPVFESINYATLDQRLAQIAINVGLNLHAVGCGASG